MTKTKRNKTLRAALNCEQLEDRCVPSTMTINGAQIFQTIDGFGTNLSSETWNSGAVTPSLDLLLSHGYKLYRVLVEPVQGWEDANPNTGQYSTSNPNWPYYNNLYGTSTKFTNLWNTISYLNNHGATVWVNLQSDAPAWMTDSGGAIGSIGTDHEADWATMVSTMVNYAVNTAHVHIDALGPMNEPDNAGDPVQGPQVGPTQYVRMMDTLETQLQSYGLGNIPLVGPDTASIGNAVSQYVPAMLADPFLMPHVFQFGFHTYQDSVSDSAITNNATYPGRHIITDEYDGPYFNEDHGQRATAAQLWTQADASFQNLIKIVNTGEHGAVIWDGVDNFYLYYNQWSAHGLISYDWTASNPTAPSDYGTTVRLYANAMMFAFAGAGAKVIGITTNASGFIETAFLNPNGQITIVGENTSGSSQTVTGTLTGGLSTSLFNYYLTNSSLNMQQQTDVTVTNNIFTFTVPADTIFTLTTPPSAPSVLGVNPIAGLTTGGQTVVIKGNNFANANGVFFGTTPATAFTINSSTQITATTPLGSGGSVDVTVTTSNATSTSNVNDKFQYYAQNGTTSPTLTTPANVTPANDQKSATLNVLGSSQYGAGALTYDWSTVGTPPAPVTFSANDNNSANNTTVNFTQTGNYTFQATITDPAGNTITSTVSVTISQVAATITVSPSNALVAPNGLQQFSGTATDQFNNPYTPVTWAVSGGGTIDNTGLFTAGSSTGGPFTVTASAGSLNTTASVTVSSGVNIAPNGTAYRWYSLGSSTSNSNKTAALGLNDNNLVSDVPLKTSGDSTNAYEAGGVTWSSSQSINKVTFTNGSFNSSTYDGVFDNNFGLQSTNDGNTWVNVSGWSLSPAYQYDLPAAAGLTYTFTGPAITGLGVRVVGQVHSRSGNDSWFDNATEIQAFSGAVSLVPTVTGLNPSSGPLSGVNVTITGTNFTGATAVSFGSAAASSFTINSSTQITAVSPGASAGSVDVTVTTPNGTSTRSPSDQFTYVSAPVITTQPNNSTVTAGQSATFTVVAAGTGLRYQWQKLVNSVWTSINGATSTTYTIGTTATTDTGSYRVSVSNVGGSTVSNSVTLTVNQLPAVTNVSPNNGPLVGGQSITITGNNFTGATNVMFGNTATSSFTVNSATQITAVDPGVMVAGSVDITVTTLNGTSATSAADQFTYVAAPVITAQPTNLTVTAGQSASFTVTASGTSLTYQWQKLVNSIWTNITGATASTYTISATVTNDAGSYWVIISNAGGSVTSSSATLTVNPNNNVNIAPNGTAYRWYGMTSATANTNKTNAPGLNDNNLTTDIPLKTSDDTSNAYEAGGVIWATTQNINKVTFTNGRFLSSSYDGVFDNNFGLQSTTNGTTWTAVSGWSLSPAYQYNLSSAAGVTYIFTGTTISVLGVRVVGQVHSRSGNDSWFDNATEIQAYDPPSTKQVLLTVTTSPSTVVTTGPNTIPTKTAAVPVRSEPLQKAITKIQLQTQRLGKNQDIWSADWTNLWDPMFATL